MQLLARHTYAVELAAKYAVEDKRPLEEVAAELTADPLNIPKGEEHRAVEKSFALSVHALPPHVQRLFALVARFAVPDIAQFAVPDIGRKAVVAIGTALTIRMTSAGIALLTRRALIDARQDTTLPAKGAATGCGCICWCRC